MVIKWRSYYLSGFNGTGVLSRMIVIDIMIVVGDCYNVVVSPR